MFSGSMKNSAHIGTCLFAGTEECIRDSVSADLRLIRLFARQKNKAATTTVDVVLVLGAFWYI